MNKITRTNSKNKIEILKLNMIRFVSVMGAWVVFFWLYGKTGSDDYRFVPVVAVMLGIYVILEIVTTALTFLIKGDEQDSITEQKEDTDTSELHTILKQLNETIERKKSSYNNGNPDQERKLSKC